MMLTHLQRTCMSTENGKNSLQSVGTSGYRVESDSPRCCGYLGSAKQALAKSVNSRIQTMEQRMTPRKLKAAAQERLWKAWSGRRGEAAGESCTAFRNTPQLICCSAAVNRNGHLHHVSNRCQQRRATSLTRVTTRVYHCTSVYYLYQTANVAKLQLRSTGQLFHNKIIHCTVEKVLLF